MTMLLGISLKNPTAKHHQFALLIYPPKKHNISHLSKRKLIFPTILGGEMLQYPSSDNHGSVENGCISNISIWGSFHLGWFSTSMLVRDRVVPGCSFWCSTMPPANPKGSSQGGLPTKQCWNFTDPSGPARFGQAKTFQSPEARSMRRRLRKGALKGKAEAEAGCPSVWKFQVMDVLSEPRWFVWDFLEKVWLGRFWGFFWDRKIRVGELWVNWNWRWMKGWVQQWGDHH